MTSLTADRVAMAAMAQNDPVWINWEEVIRQHYHTELTISRALPSGKRGMRHIPKERRQHVAAYRERFRGSWKMDLTTWNELVAWKMAWGR